VGTGLDCLVKFRQYIQDAGLAAPEQMDKIEEEERRLVGASRREAWRHISPIQEERKQVAGLLIGSANSEHSAELTKIREKLVSPNPLRRDIMAAAIQALVVVRKKTSRKTGADRLERGQEVLIEERYCSHLHNQSATSALEVQANPPRYSEDSPSCPWP
jgi:hypothetical protein